ncbi:MAG: DUF6318 family protein [Knoellia sp.]
MAARHRTTEGFRTMKSRRTLTYAVAAAAAATLLLGACNGGNEDPPSMPNATTSPTGSASASGSTDATASPSPSVSVSLPSAARANTEAGAIAFAKFFVTEMDRAYVEADSEPLKPLFTKNCEDCQNVVEIIDKLEGSGTHQATSSATIAGATYAKLSGQPAVDVFVAYASVNRLDKAGKVVFTGKERKVSYRLRLANTNGWLVDEIGTL